MQPVTKQFIFAATGASLMAVAGSFIAPVETRYLQSLTPSPIWIGVTFGVGTVLLGMLSFFLGRLSDRYGRKTLIIGGCIAGILYPLLYASTLNIFQYMGVKAIWAFSTAATGPIFMAYLQNLLQNIPEKGRYIGLMYSAQSVAGAGAAFLGGALAERYGLAAPYVGISFFFALALFFVIFSLKNDREVMQTKTEAATEPRDFLFGFRYIAKSPALIFYIFEKSAFSLNWGVKAFLWPLIIYGMTGQDFVTGSIFGTMGVVAFICLLFVGKVTDMIGPFRSSITATLILMCSGLVLVFTGNVTLFWIAAGIFATGEALHGVAEGVLLTDHVPSSIRGEILGINAIVESILGTIAPFVAGFLLTKWSPQMTLLPYMILFILALFIQLFLFKTRLKTQEQNAQNA